MEVIQDARKARNDESGADTLNSREAAAYFGVHVETVRRLARRSELPAFKLGRDWRFSKSTLAAWRERNRGGKPVVLLLSPRENEREQTVRLLHEAGYRTVTAEELLAGG